MHTFRVSLKDTSGVRTLFECRAEDEDAAEEQAKEKHPDCEILWVAVVP